MRNRIYVVSTMLIFLILISCKSKMISNEDVKITCNLFEKDFDVNIHSYKKFHEEMKDFISKEYEYDILKVFTKGGNPKESKLVRYFLPKKTQWTKIEIENEERQKSMINYSSTLIEKISRNKKRSYMQICPYSSNNDSYLILIKVNGKYIFKYNSISEDYYSLKDSDRSKIIDAIKLVESF